MNNNAITCEVIAKHSTHAARVTKVTTAHGSFLTPTFMPVGTYAAVNCMLATQLAEAGSQIILGGNTYHMLVYPGMETIEKANGMHYFMNWQNPMLTDSGGFQVFSLSKNSKICRIDENGAKFKHPTNGNTITLNAKTSIETQKIIGADIIMAFDQCTPEIGGREAALAALDRTHRWLLKSLETHQQHPNNAYGSPQALFAIIQGGSYRDLREQSAEFILSQPVDGIAIGGEVIGFDMIKTAEVLTWLEPMLPATKTRYTMGVGLHPQDLITVVKHGIDIFDCVAPTRNARHGSLYHGFAVPDGDWLTFQAPDDDNSKMLIKKQIYAHDEKPILANCDCYTCQHHTRAYLHFLFKKNHPLYYPLASIHNIRVMQKTCETMRDVISCT